MYLQTPSAVIKVTWSLAFSFFPLTIEVIEILFLFLVWKCTHWMGEFFCLCHHNSCFSHPSSYTAIPLARNLKKESEIQNSWLRVQVTFSFQLFPSSLRYALYPKAFFFSKIDTFAGQNSVLIYDAQATKIIWDFLE